MRNLRTVKINLRKKYRGRREAMAPEKKAVMDERITSRLLLLDKYEKSKTIFTYVSKDVEVSTYGIIRDALNRKKRVAVPKCDVQNRRMDFYFIKSTDDLEKGTFGVYEPIESQCVLAEDFTKGLCIVPGFCFDYDGYRLGYGHGYYDRFLPRFKGFTIGLCYGNCVRFKLPRGRFDRAVDILITDKYVKKIYAPRKTYARNKEATFQPVRKIADFKK